MADTSASTTDARAKALLDKLWADNTPLGANVRKQAKELFPDIVLPEDGAELAVAPVKAELDDVKIQLKGALDRISAREKADVDLAAENELSMKISTAQRSFGLTDAGKQKMIERMKTTGNFSDADAAAAWVVSQTPKPEPTSAPSWMPEAANLFGSQQKDDQFEALHKNPQKYMDDQLREFVRDPDKYVSETFGTA